METFVVRVFVPAGDETVELTGVVEHPASGRNRHFRDPNGLLDAVRTELSLAEHARGAPASGDPLGVASSEGTPVTATGAWEPAATSSNEPNGVLPSQGEE